MTGTSPIHAAIDAMSRSNRYDDPQIAADKLACDFANVDPQTVLDAIDSKLADETWSQDREPYQWLASVRAAWVG